VAGAAPEAGLQEALALGKILRSSAPRLVRDGFGPLAVFFAGWKLVGLVPGICAAAAFGAAVFVHERRSGRPAMVVRLALLLVAIRATVGLSSGNARTYLGQEIGIDTLLGTAILLSLLSARPFIARFSADVYTLPDALRESDAYRAAMRRLTIVWGCYFLLRAVVRTAALLTLSTDSYALVIALSDAPFLVALLAWSVYHTAGVFRRSPQWAPLIAAAEASREASA
jgi:intracellular septation protein A